MISSALAPITEVLSGDRPRKRAFSTIPALTPSQAAGGRGSPQSSGVMA